MFTSKDTIQKKLKYKKFANYEFEKGLVPRISKELKSQ